MAHANYAPWFGAAVLLTSLVGCGGSRPEPQTSRAGSPADAEGRRAKTGHYQLSPNAPEDRPFGAPASFAAPLDQMVAPYVRQARETYPDAKRRYLAGLPPGETFFVTTRLRDPEGRFEQSFIHVEGISGDVIAGSIASDITLARGFRRGDHYEFREADLVDWLISKPDGSEEGNVVGKFLDTSQR